MKKVFFSLLSFFLLPPLIVFAQSAPGTKIASVNVGQVQVQQTGKSYAISFTITNGSEVQTGLHYGVRLIQQNANKQYVVDEQSYDEALTLRENDAITKQITYTPPETLTGAYQLYITIYNGSGLPFAIAYGDVVNLSGIGGVVIQPETCIVQAGAMKGDINKTVFLSTNTKFTLTCTAKNSGSESVTVQPNIETNIGSIFGSKVQTAESAPAAISFSAGEQKTITVLLPKPTAPQTYTAKVWLAQQTTNSNAVIVRYTITGSMATIQNLSFDKDSYVPGEKAQLSLFWNGSVSSAQLNATVKNSFGVACSDAISQTITTKPITIIPVSITKTCFNPKVSMVLKDSNGAVLDQKDFSVQSKANSNNRKMVTLAVIGILVIALVSWFMKNRKKKPLVSPIVLLLIGVAIIGVFHGTAHADSYASGPNGDIVSVVDLPSGTQYSSGATIQVSGQVFNYSSTTAYPVSLTVTNNNGTPVVFIPDSPTTTLGAGQSTRLYQYTYTNGAPAVVGTYPVKFRTGVDSTGGAMQFNGGGPYATPVQGGTGDTNVVCSGGLTLPALSSGETLVFQYQTDYTRSGEHRPYSYTCNLFIPAGQTSTDDYPGVEYVLPSGTSVQVLNYCFDAAQSSVPNNQSISGVPSC